LLTLRRVLSSTWRKLTAPADGPWGDSADVQLTLLLDKLQAMDEKHSSIPRNCAVEPHFRDAGWNTVSGRGDGEEADSLEGGRQTARNLFDLHVLSSAFKSIRYFMETLPYSFPSGSFDNGLASMRWFQLMDELTEIVCAPK
jgi:hypothetical protein